MDDATGHRVDHDAVLVPLEVWAFPGRVALAYRADPDVCGGELDVWLGAIDALHAGDAIASCRDQLTILSARTGALLAVDVRADESVVTVTVVRGLDDFHLLVSEREARELGRALFLAGEEAMDLAEHRESMEGRP